MTTARDYHTATLLPDGKVLIAGGYSSFSGGSYSGGLSAAELYDPTTGTFTATGDMTTAHDYHLATLLPNGKVLIAGGSRHEPLHSAEIYDPFTRSLLRLPQTLIEALERHRAVQEEERLLAGSAWIGGSEYVFTSTVGTPLEQRRVHHVFHELCHTAGLRRIRFHDLRHSAASMLIALGVHPKAIQELLRHSSIQLTMDTYGHLFDEVQRETADKMDALLGAEKAPKTSSVAVKVAVNPRLVRLK